MKHLHVLGFGEEAPSTVFRWKALSRGLEAQGWKMTVETEATPGDPAALSRADVVVLQKRMVSLPEWRRIRRASRCLIYDADDRIWMREGRPYGGWTAWKIRRRVQRICRGADLCLAANRVIAADLKSFGGRVEILPMSIETDRWKVRSGSPGNRVVGWTGGPKNLGFMEAKLPAILPVMRGNSDWKLVVHSGKNSEFVDPAIHWEPFCSGSEPEVVGCFNIGLCPLPQDPFAAGKSPIKILQYWSTGAAVIASPVGAVNEWIRHGENGLLAGSDREWPEMLQSLIHDAEWRGRLAEAGRSEVVRFYSCQRVAKRLACLLDSFI